VKPSVQSKATSYLPFVWCQDAPTLGGGGGGGLRTESNLHHFPLGQLNQRYAFEGLPLTPILLKNKKKERNRTTAREDKEKPLSERGTPEKAPLIRMGLGYESFFRFGEG